MHACGFRRRHASIKLLHANRQIKAKPKKMFWVIFVILLVLWALGSICHIAFSYLLLVIALIVLITGWSEVEHRKSDELTYANPTAGDTANFACTPPRFRTNADGQYVAGDAPDRSGHDRWLLAGSNWRGRGGLLGWDRDWFAPLRKTDPKCRAHSRLCGSRSSRIDRTPPALASDDPIAWVVARALTGFCFAGLFIVVESWLNGVATDETRGQILSVYAMTGLLAGILGQLLLPVTDSTGFKPFCIVAIIIALALVPIALTRAEAPTPWARAPGST